MSATPYVLVADDDEEVRNALAHVLESVGVAVMPVCDGQAALDHLEQAELPCAVLLDWVMPRMNGDGFLSARARSEALSSVPVFVISATWRPALDKRIQGFLQKPITTPELVAMIRAVCDRHCPSSRRAACRSPRRGPEERVRQ